MMPIAANVIASPLRIATHRSDVEKLIYAFSRLTHLQGDEDLNRRTSGSDTRRPDDSSGLPCFHPLKPS
jgi:hypothetical protein